MTHLELIPHIEALIFAADRPLTSLEITEYINKAFALPKEQAQSIDTIQNGINTLIEKYKNDAYPFSIRQVGGGWQFLTKANFYTTVAQINQEKFVKKLSTAALETLAIIAYRQPIAKHQIEAIRGVNSDYAVQKLLEKELITIEGRNEQLPGKPIMYGTSRNFMDYLGINAIEDLPPIAITSTSDTQAT